MRIILTSLLMFFLCNTTEIEDVQKIVCFNANIKYTISTSEQIYTINSMYKDYKVLPSYSAIQYISIESCKDIISIDVHSPLFVNDIKIFCEKPPLWRKFIETDLKVLKNDDVLDENIVQFLETDKTITIIFQLNPSLLKKIEAIPTETMRCTVTIEFDIEYAVGDAPKAWLF